MQYTRQKVLPTTKLLWLLFIAALISFLVISTLLDNYTHTMLKASAYTIIPASIEGSANSYSIKCLSSTGHSVDWISCNNHPKAEISTQTP